MQQTRFATLRRHIRQAGQGMTEYIIIVALIAVASIVTYSYFGDTLRLQVGAAALAVSGKDGTSKTTEAQTQAGEAADDANTKRNLEDFAKEKPGS